MKRVAEAEAKERLNEILDEAQREPLPVRQRLCCAQRAVVKD